MNEDMSDMIKNLSNMLNSKDMPDDIKILSIIFLPTIKILMLKIYLQQTNTLLIHLLLKATQI